MNKLSVFGNEVGLFLNRNSPTILTTLGVSGMIGSIFMAVRITPRVIDRIAAKEYRAYLENKHIDPISTPSDMFVQVFHDAVGGHLGLYIDMKDPETYRDILVPFLPVFGLASVSVLAIFLGNRVHLKRTSALASAYTIIDKTLRDYELKVGEILTKKQQGELSEAVAIARIHTNPADDRNTYGHNNGYDLCYESYTGRYFYTTPEMVRRIFNDHNARLLQENALSFNEVLYDFGLPGVELGDVLGWVSENGLIEPILKARLVDPDDKPCLTIDFEPTPKPLWS